MYTVEHCLCCGNKEIYKYPAYLSKFVTWRITGQRPESNIPNELIYCDQCEFSASKIRFDKDEVIRLYNNYRSEEYNLMRRVCEPNYNLANVYSEEYKRLRKEFITNFLHQHLDFTEILNVIDYGGDTGYYIPDLIVGHKYVYDIGGAELLPGINFYNFTDEIYFDLIMNCQVLEHESDLYSPLRKMRKLTKLGSYIYIEVPAYKTDIPTNIVIGEHINFFKKESLVTLLNRHGFQIINTAVDYDLKVLAILGKV